MRRYASVISAPGPFSRCLVAPHCPCQMLPEHSGVPTRTAQAARCKPGDHPRPVPVTVFLPSTFFNFEMEISPHACCALRTPCASCFSNGRSARLFYSNRASLSWRLFVHSWNARMKRTQIWEKECGDHRPSTKRGRDSLAAAIPNTWQQSPLDKYVGEEVRVRLCGLASFLPAKTYLLRMIIATYSLLDEVILVLDDDPPVDGARFTSSVTDHMIAHSWTGKQTEGWEACVQGVPGAAGRISTSSLRTMGCPSCSRHERSKQLQLPRSSEETHSTWPQAARNSATSTTVYGRPQSLKTSCAWENAVVRQNWSTAEGRLLRQTHPGSSDGVCERRWGWQLHAIWHRSYLINVPAWIKWMKRGQTLRWLSFAPPASHRTHSCHKDSAQTNRKRTQSNGSPRAVKQNTRRCQQTLIGSVWRLSCLSRRQSVRYRAHETGIWNVEQQASPRGFRNTCWVYYALFICAGRLPMRSFPNLVSRGLFRAPVRFLAITGWTRWRRRVHLQSHSFKFRFALFCGLGASAIFWSFVSVFHSYVACPEGHARFAWVRSFVAEPDSFRSVRDQCCSPVAAPSSTMPSWASTLASGLGGGPGVPLWSGVRSVLAGRGLSPAPGVHSCLLGGPGVLFQCSLAGRETPGVFLPFWIRFWWILWTRRGSDRGPDE